MVTLNVDFSLYLFSFDDRVNVLLCSALKRMCCVLVFQCIIGNFIVRVYWRNVSQISIVSATKAVAEFN